MILLIDEKCKISVFCKLDSYVTHWITNNDGCILHKLLIKVVI